MRRMTRLFPIMCGLVCAIFLSCLAPCPAQAAGTYNVGFRTLGFWGGERGLRFDINVWYPTIRREKDFQYGIWTLYGARNGKAVEGRFPLILVSHATAGTRYTYHDTCYALAARGFVVAALTHPHDCMDNMDHIFTWKQLSVRTEELSAAISVLGDDRDISASIDMNRVGVLGFGSGGAAALLLGGALPNCDGWGGYCREATEDDVYCNSWTQEKMQAMCGTFPLKKSLADTRFKAVAIAQPDYAMLFKGESLKYFHPPLLVLGADTDANQLRRSDAEAIVRAAQTFQSSQNRGADAARFESLKAADTGALMASCPESLAVELPELCRTVSGQQRAAIHDAMQDELEDFFLKYLGDAANVPHIPQPPDLAPITQVQDAPAQETGKGRQNVRGRARQSGRARP